MLLRLKINKYVFWSYIHKLIDDPFDTKHQKIIFKNGKEEYTKENIEISFTIMTTKLS